LDIVLGMVDDVEINGQQAAKDGKIKQKSCWCNA
jgi:hypothetical protein